MGRLALRSHASGKSHKKHFDRKQFFFKSKNSEQSKACSSSSQNNTPIETVKDNEPTVANCQYRDYAKRLSKAKN